MTGTFIGATFGMLFVVLNAHEPLNSAVSSILRALAVLALVSLIAIWTLASKRANASGNRAPSIAVQTGGFGARFWLIVAGEVVLLIAGLTLLRFWNAPQEANIGWIAFVVGLHLIAFVTVWHQRSIIVPGVILTVLGLGGLVMATAGVVAWVPIVSGVLSGIALLACSLTFATRELVHHHADGEA